MDRTIVHPIWLREVGIKLVIKFFQGPQLLAYDIFYIVEPN